MPNALYDVNINMSVSVPIIGDESIILISPPAGFTYRKTVFNEYEYKDRLIDGTGNVSFDFYYAVHDTDQDRCIITLERNEQQVVQHHSPANSIGFMFNGGLSALCQPIQDRIEQGLLKYFSMIHLYKEGEIARKYSFYDFSTQEGMCKSNSKQIPVCADMITVIRNPLVIKAEEVADINSFLTSHDRAYSILKDIVIDDLEYTYHVLDDTTNYKNLITTLEVMFLSKDYGSKKEMLSRRIAVFLGQDDAEINSLYTYVKGAYVDRSDAVHEGGNITKDRLNELRNLVRRCIKKYMSYIESLSSPNSQSSFDSIKEGLIKKLKRTVKLKVDNGVLPPNANEKPICFWGKLFNCPLS